MDYSVKRQKGICGGCGYKYEDTGWYSPTSNYCYDYDYKREGRKAPQGEDAAGCRLLMMLDLNI